MAGVVGLLSGGALLYLGAEWLVSGVSGLALSLRIPQIVVGLTVVAYGTSMPEVVVGIQAAFSGHGDVALGNVVGSNIFNILLCLGVAALAGNVGAPLSTVAVDVVALVAITLLAAYSLRRARTMSRPEGAAVGALHLLFLGTLAAGR